MSAVFGLITFFAGFLTVGCVIWLIVSLGKKRRATHPKGWRLPLIIAGCSLAAAIGFGILSNALEGLEIATKAEEDKIARAEKAERDSVFAWAISDNPDTASLTDIREAVGIFDKRGWEPSEELLERGIALHLDEAENEVKDAATLSEIEEAFAILDDVDLYGELNWQQQNKLDNLEWQLDQKREAIRVDERKEFARGYEYELLDQRFDATVTVSGSNATVLKVEWILVSRVTAHEIGQDQTLLQVLRELGFKKFIISNGYGDSWYWNL